MRLLNKKAISIIEYSVLFIIIISAFLVMRNNIQRKFNGKWEESGKTFAYGRQYDPQRSIDCSFDDQSMQWYDRNCYVYYVKIRGCNGDKNCEEGVITANLCPASSCNELNHGAPL